MTHFDKIFSRSWLQKTLMQIIVVSRNFCKFALTHWTYLLRVRKIDTRKYHAFHEYILNKSSHEKSRLRNLYIKKKTDTSRISYIKQRNYCLSLFRKTKKDHYANLN